MELCLLRQCTMTMNSQDPFIVGVGSSAGGIESLFELFSHIPADINAAFIIVRHLKRDAPTEMSMLLSRYTPLETRTIEGGEKPEVGRIYLMPQNTKVYMENGLLRLEPRPEDEIINKAIDRLFISLANDAKDKAMGIILSGTGDDGVEGARAIEDNEGLVIVETPDTAQFTQLPENLIAKNHPDHVLPPHQMHFVLLDFIHRKTQERDNGLLRNGQ